MANDKERKKLKKVVKMIFTKDEVLESVVNALYSLESKALEDVTPEQAEAHFELKEKLLKARLKDIDEEFFDGIEIVPVEFWNDYFIKVFEAFPQENKDEIISYKKQYFDAISK